MHTSVTLSVPTAKKCGPGEVGDFVISDVGLYTYLILNFSKTEVFCYNIEGKYFCHLQRGALDSCYHRVPAPADKVIITITAP